MNKLAMLASMLPVSSWGIIQNVTHNIIYTCPSGVRIDHMFLVHPFKDS